MQVFPLRRIRWGRVLGRWSGVKFSNTVEGSKEKPARNVRRKGVLALSISS